MSVPISPDEVVEHKANNFPDVVFDVFNALIAQGWDGNSSTVYQDEVVKGLEAHGLNRREVYDRHWLDVEPVYEEAGWAVEYDKPMGYAGETYRAHFIFRKKKAKR